jgi:hypothetical protein
VPVRPTPSSPSCSHATFTRVTLARSRNTPLRTDSAVGSPLFSDPTGPVFAISRRQRFDCKLLHLSGSRQVARLSIRRRIQRLSLRLEDLSDDEVSGSASCQVRPSSTGYIHLMLIRECLDVCGIAIPEHPSPPTPAYITQLSEQKTSIPLSVAGRPTTYADTYTPPVSLAKSIGSWDASRTRLSLAVPGTGKASRTGQ